LTAESLGGKLKFLGDFPLAKVLAPTPASDPTDRSANGNLKVVGVSLLRLWKALEMTGTVAQLEGLGASEANLRYVVGGPDAGLWLHGVSEFRNLGWGPHYPLGQLRGIVALTPNGWRIDPISGELLGGFTRGVVWGTTPAEGQTPEARRVGFEFRVDRVSLKRALSLAPDLANNVVGSGNFRVGGTLGDSLRASAEVDVPLAELAGLPVRELRAPIELVLAPTTRSGTLQIRRGSARLAGGQVHGDGWFRLGDDRSFHGEIQLSGIDLESISRFQSDTRRPTSGRVSGRITLGGHDPAALQSYRGKLSLDLDDASLVYLPVFREIDRFLGSARGGLFEDGDLEATIANRQVVVEMLTLEGRVAQLHATGTVGFDQQLDLEVLINTNQIIPQTGQALVRLVPGLSDVVGRNEQASLRFANFLSTRLLKLRVTGTVRNPSVIADPGVVVADTAVGFFAGVLKLPLGLVK
jgi:translocation and assembly module TamB